MIVSFKVLEGWGGGNIGRVMFFGLTNSLATFQTMMNEIFQDLISEGVVCVYLDDILIFMETMEEHDQVTCLVLERL